MCLMSRLSILVNVSIKTDNMCKIPCVISYNVVAYATSLKKCHSIQNIKSKQ